MLKQCSEDYAGLAKLLGSTYLNFVNKYIFPIHFNHITIQNTKFKYAVVEQADVINDLKSWQLLTLAGRLHKPVYYNMLDQKEDIPLANAIKLNHRLALNVALLTLIGKVPPNGELTL